MSFNTTVREETLVQYHFIAADTQRRFELAQAEWDRRESEKTAQADGGDMIINHLIVGDAHLRATICARAHHDLTAACERHYQWCKEVVR
jgi:hypothetical protein